MLGFEALKKHVPGLHSTKRCIAIGLTALACLLAGLSFLYLVDAYWPDYTMDGSVELALLGFLLLAVFFRQKTRLRKRHGKKAYPVAFGRFVLTGLPFIFASIAHIAYMPGPDLPVGWWTLAIILLGWYLSIAGATLWLRSILAFGVDNLVMLYVYHPEESRVVDSSIYAVIRHPVYAGVIRLGLGLALLNNNWFALTCAILLWMGLTIWIGFIEEKELIERFGQGYVEYRQKTPAFWPGVNKYGKFFRFLVTGR
jgi:protein-S-isoprenylcysteine O-methyltransferase Ste14